MPKKVGRPKKRWGIEPSDRVHMYDFEGYYREPEYHQGPCLNCGRTVALVDGFCRACGASLLPMDTLLDDPPEYLDFPYWYEMEALHG